MWHLFSIEVTWLIRDGGVVSALLLWFVVMLSTDYV